MARQHERSLHASLVKQRVQFPNNRFCISRTSAGGLCTPRCDAWIRPRPSYVSSLNREDANR